VSSRPDTQAVTVANPAVNHRHCAYELAPPLWRARRRQFDRTCRPPFSPPRIVAQVWRWPTLLCWWRGWLLVTALRQVEECCEFLAERAQDGTIGRRQGLRSKFADEGHELAQGAREVSRRLGPVIVQRSTPSLSTR
jgi:hypothetical protein